MNASFLSAAAVAALGIALAACQTTTGVQSRFDPDEASYILGDGDNSVRGQAFLKRTDGQVVTCAGERVYLVPAASRYAQERIRRIYGTTETSALSRPDVRIGEADPRYVELTRTTRCRHDGSFAFAGVPDGPYFVVTWVLWYARAGGVRQGGTVMAPVALAGGETVDLIVP